MGHPLWIARAAWKPELLWPVNRSRDTETGEREDRIGAFTQRESMSSTLLLPNAGEGARRDAPGK